MLLPQKVPGTRDTLPPKRTWDQGYPTPKKRSGTKDIRVNRLTDTCGNINLPATSLALGKHVRDTTKVISLTYETNFNRTIDTVFPMFTDYLKGRYANNEGQ